MDFSILFKPAAVPFWTLLGVLITQATNWAIAKMKGEQTVHQSAITGHETLNASLLASFTTMSEELARLREDRERDAAEYRAKEDAYLDRIKHLEAELEELRRAVENATCPTCTPEII